MSASFWSIAVSKKFNILLFFIAFIVIYIPFVKNHGVALINEDSGDFPSFYFGAKLAFVEKESPYVPDNLRQAFKEYTGNNGDYFPYLYMPSSLIFFLPFTWVSYDVARQAMLILNHLFILLFIYLFLFKVLKTKSSDIFSTLFVLYIFSFAPLYVILDNGQINIFILILICLTWYFAKEQKSPWWVALPLSLAIILKLYPALLLIPLLFRKQYKAVGYTIFLTLLISGIVTLFLPNGIWDTWYANVGSKGYAQTVLNLSTNAPANQSIYGMLTRTFFGRNVRFAPILVVPGWVSQIAPYGISGIVFLFSLFVSFTANRNGSLKSISIPDMDFSLWSIVSFLIAPISWDHHLLFIVPALAVLIYSLLYLSERKNYLLLGISIATALALAIPFPYNSPAFREGIKTLLMSTSLYITGLLWLQVIFYLFSTSRSGNAAKPELG